MLTNRVNTFCLYKVLYDYSDADNILSRADIDQKLECDYGISMNRHTLRESLAVLGDMGFEISVYEDNGKGYYLETREFELSEVRLLIDSVFFNSAIPQKQTDKLVKKLQGLLPEYKRKRYKNLTVATSAKKTVNKELFFNIDILDEAISERKKVEFDYYHYNFKKELVKKRDDKYSVCPYALIAAREHYYLIGKFDNAENFTHFRVDKIKGIKITEVKFAKDDFDVSKYADVNTMMHGGDYIEAKFRCKNWTLDYLIDEFGQDARIFENDDGETFTATVKGSFEGIRIWAMHYLDCAEVVEPQVLRNAVIKNIKNNMYGV